MQIYITDTTKQPVKDVTFNDYPSAVRYLEGISQRAFGQTRKSYMILLESMGHGEDDQASVNFVRAMAERIEIGVIREGRKMRCDITSAFMFNKPEYGS
jgi:hypothetical protein